MKIIKIAISIFIFFFQFGVEAQTLVDQDIIRISRSSVATPNGIYFNGSDVSGNGGVYFMDNSENVTYLVSGGTIQFEYNNYLYVRQLADHTILRIDLSTNNVDPIFSDSNIFILSSLIEYMDQFYFVGYDLTDADYFLMSLDDNGNLLPYGVDESFPGPLQNTIRLHETNDIFYIFSNTLSPAAQHFYKYIPPVGTLAGIMSSISPADYGGYPFDFGLDNVTIGGEIFSINAQGQLTSDVNPIDLTCFDLVGEEGIPVPQLLGSIGQSVYMVLGGNFGSPNGIYKYPETTTGLCGGNMPCNENNNVVDFNGTDNSIMLMTPLSGNSNYTLEAQFKAGTQGSGPYNRIFSFTGFEAEVAINTTTLSFYDGVTWNNTSINVADNQWHSVSLTRDGSDFELWLDGAMVLSVVRPTTLNFAGNFAIGVKHNSSGEYFTGQIDEVRVWDRPLSSTELNANGACQLTGSESGLVLYYNFEQGDPNGDNTSIVGPLDLAGGNDIGTFENFSLTGNQSNYICSSNYPGCGNPPPGCEDICVTTSVDLSTGVNFNDGSLLPVGVYEGAWELISGPDPINYPIPGYVINPDPAWNTLPGAQYISPYANTSNNDMFPEPYLFERCFCVCEASSIELNVEALFDNFINVGLYDDAGNLIQELIDYPGPAVPSTFQLPALSSTTTHQLSPGVYCLRAGLRNDGGVSLGMAIKASVTGAGLIESGCCSPFTIINGTVFQDTECNNVNNFGSDPGLANYSVSLCDPGGNPVATTTTDAFGFYSFRDIDPGAYFVKLNDNSSTSLGSQGYSLIVLENSVQGDIDFGICIPPGCEDICVTTSVDLSTGVNFNDGSLLPVGSYEGGWQMISGPDQVNYPLAGYVINPDPAWNALPGAQYISPYANTSNNDMFPEPYLFERCFCVCEASTIQLNVETLFDNFVNIGLYDEAGNLIQELIDYPGPAVPSTFQLPALSSTTSHDLSPGVYCLRAGLRNDGGVSLGMAVRASVSGAGLIESGCCTPFTLINGTVFQDTECNSVNNFGADPGLPNYTVSLCDASGNSIATTTTDAFGFYSFADVNPGSYLVKLTDNADVSLGAQGYNISVLDNMVVGDNDFGICLPCSPDNEAPICILQEFTVDLGSDLSAAIIFADLDNGSSDNCGELITTLSNSQFGCNQIGTNIVNVTIADAAGNTTTCQTTVTITDQGGFCEPCNDDTESPTLNCPSQTVSFDLDDTGTVNITATDLGVSSTDNCDVVNIEISNTSFTCDDLGIQSLFITASDNSQNSSGCTINISINDPMSVCVDSCCGTPAELSQVVFNNIDHTLITYTDGDVDLATPDLLSCQYVSRVLWGDGAIDILNAGDIIPEHMYEEEGVYVISIEVTAQNTNGSICQVDTKDLIVLVQICPTLSTQSLNENEVRLKTYPIPTLNILTIELTDNAHGYNAKLLNVNGQETDVFSISAGDRIFEFDSSGLTSGVYYLILESKIGGDTLETRIIKL